MQDQAKGSLFNEWLYALSPMSFMIRNFNNVIMFCYHQLIFGICDACKRPQSKDSWRAIHCCVL